MLSEALIEPQELADAERSKQKRNCKTRGVHRKKQNTARNRIAGGGQREHGRENRPDARRPAERERETKEEPAPDAGLRAAGVQAHVAVEPARHRRPEESDHGQREKVHGTESGEERSAAEKRDGSENGEQHAENQAGAHGQFYQYPKQVQTEKMDEGAGDGSE